MSINGALTEDVSPLRWFVVESFGGCEEIAAKRVAALGFTVLVPKLAETRRIHRRGRGVETVVRLLFPRYFLVEFDPACAWQVINRTPKVLGVVASGDTPLPVRRREAALLLERCTGTVGKVTGVWTDPPKPEPPAIGAELRMLDGPFASFLGKVSALDDDGRVQLLLSVLGREVPVWVDPHQVEPA